MLKLFLTLISLLSVSYTHAGVMCNSIPSTVPALIQEAAQAAVTINVTFRSLNGEEITFGGSGYVVSQEGRIAATFHVIGELYRRQKAGLGQIFYSVILADCRKFFVTPIFGPHDGAFFPDIVFLDIVNPPKNLSVAVFAEKLPEEGELVYSIGSPKGKTNTITKGTIISKIIFTNMGTPLIQAAIKVEGGASGGLLVNTQGKLIAMTKGYDCLKSKNSDYRCDTNGYFIPASLVKNWLDFLTNRS